MALPAMRLDIFADTICPWCYIGKRRLETALGMALSSPGAGLGRTLAIQWRPFLLNPGMPAGGMNRKAYLAWKFGGAGRAEFIADRVAQEGLDDGIPFAFERIARTPNTLDSHRLIAFAQTAGDATPVVEALFAAYFSEGRDIGDRDELAAIGAQCGFDETALRRYLASEAGIAEVMTANDHARALGINAVPCFVFDEREALAGAQPPEVFLRLFDFARQQTVDDDVVP
jgi:predicted DsbA family dithiol-disulfide isomerase